MTSSSKLMAPARVSDTGEIAVSPTSSKRRFARYGPSGNSPRLFELRSRQVKDPKMISPGDTVCKLQWVSLRDFSAGKAHAGRLGIANITLVDVQPLEAGDCLDAPADRVPL